MMKISSMRFSRRLHAIIEWMKILGWTTALGSTYSGHTGLITCSRRIKSAARRRRTLFQHRSYCPAQQRAVSQCRQAVSQLGFLSREAQAAFQKISFDNKGPVDSLRIDIPKDYIPLADRRQNGVNYMDLDEQKLSDPNPPLQLIKDSLAEWESRTFRRFEHRSTVKRGVYRSDCHF